MKKLSLKESLKKDNNDGNGMILPKYTKKNYCYNMTRIIK